MLGAKMGRAGLPLPGAIARRIGTLILSGHYKPGDLIHGEVDASRDIGVSRTAYREAMLILTAKGLVERRRKAGTRVTPAENWHGLDPDILEWTFACEGAGQSLASFFELRRLVEPEVAAIAATRRSADHITEMRRALELMGAGLQLIKSGREPLSRFRTSMFRASANPLLGKLGHVIERTVLAFDRGPGSVGMTDCEIRGNYVDVFNGLLAKDPAHARRAMRDVIDRTWCHVSEANARAVVRNNSQTAPSTRRKRLNQ